MHSLNSHTWWAGPAIVLTGLEFGFKWSVGMRAPGALPGERLAPTTYLLLRGPL